MEDRNRKTKKTPDSKAESAASAYRSAGETTDPLGSYTGNPSSQAKCVISNGRYPGGKIYMRLPEDKKPVQDADDL